ncbi:MAG: hypothetical protein AMXMBFR53_01250 [Gemmatimonadota bacterium]
MTRFGVGRWLVALVGVALAAAPAASQQVVDLPGEDKVLPAALPEVFRVGSMDGDEWETFGENVSVAFDARGQLYIFDRQSSRVVVTDATGAFVREVGKAGEGPGELRMPVGFTVLRDGSVVIADVGHRAYQVFGPDGAFKRMVSFAGDGSVIRLGQLSPDPRGNAIFSGGGRNMVVSMSAGPGGAPEMPRGRPIERVSLEGSQAKPQTVVSAWEPPPAEGPAPTVQGGGVRFSMSMAGPRTFEPALFVGPLADGGLAYADSTGYAVKVAGANGTLERVLRRPFRPRPVTPAMQEAEKKRQLDELAAGGGPRVQMRMVTDGGQVVSPNADAIRKMQEDRVAQMQFYPELPVLMNMATGWSGKIWVVRRGDQPTEEGPIDVLTPAGQYVGTFAKGSLELPSAFGPEGMVAFVERDEFDVPTVVVRRLPAVLR